MDKADGDFLQKLFRENNELRAWYTAQQRELYNKTNLLENAEEEIKQIRLKINADAKSFQPQTLVSSRPSKKQSEKKDGEPSTAPTNNIGDLEEALFSNSRQQTEIKKLREEMSKLQTELDYETEKAYSLTREGEVIAAELQELRKFKKEAGLKETSRDVQEQSTPTDIETYQSQIRNLEGARLEMKQQMMSIASEANRMHNSQQNQLQGIEGLIEGTRKEYEEFIKITKLENESFRALQQADYDSLKKEFQEHKNQSFEEKKNLMMEYQSILSAMQAQFDEYRLTAELLFNVELVKLEDELSSQAARYEQEIMYVIQAKDKFYSDMMVAKDAKIMGLIEGSDLQSTIQKHELDMENARKEHLKELERVKSEHDSESKNVTLLLQRQNISLESKTEKLQAHLKAMEFRMKDLMNTIDIKNKTIAERDETRNKAEQEYQKKLTESNDRISILIQEKEHLRHRVIRLNLNSKGEGENSVENMLRRLSKGTANLQSEFEELDTKYDLVLKENQQYSKKIMEREKMVEFLEKEISRRSQEFSDMTRTFEEFLAGRSRQALKDRARRLSKMGCEDAESTGEPSPPPLGQQMVDGHPVFKARIPNRIDKLPRAPDVHSPIQTLTNNIELERGYLYLKRFKNLSRAFSTGEFRALANADRSEDNTPGPWKKIPLYTKLDDSSLAVVKMHREQQQRPSPVFEIPSRKPVLYIPPDAVRPNALATGQGVIKIYNEKLKDGMPQKKTPRTKSSKGIDELKVGGTNVA
ncbi:hypothetical protein BASA50_006275 [Batrachochytrium salamandrivorans]|uniref:Cilia- and flagella-associated protein 157 n=1 Tax=Batrachochytrium salamandrivorans TaxID=1357716 RepID=A0ABQ8FBN1_9FUNG|nr:hypothetical protein BASA62_006896 [Batrachochytrium salamandrivorans]KAH6594801.1 hypothetical protein BASA50_006275 [Batrachochytrium salamandrivorans]KAH6597992.1 hypothetical protein BASA61_002977 [Batrachochytrium salamandrivorans]KAH9257425.1 hypothetical protein BASA81_004350 [Batrachochytrium salamandrivorans]KAH9267222.1 hypothetical protein BASA84_000764 [Batrachochytrium salamandrivorans]